MRIGSGRQLILISAVTTVVYLAIVLGTAPYLADRAGGMAVFDLKPMGYDASYAAVLLDRLGEEGRRFYLMRQIPLDLFYPALLAIWLLALWRYLVGKAGLTMPWLRHAWFVPVLAAFFDYGENAAVASLLVTFPDLDANVVRLASGFTLLKSAVTTVCFTAVLTLGALVAFRRLRRPAGRPHLGQRGGTGMPPIDESISMR